MAPVRMILGPEGRRYNIAGPPGLWRIQYGMTSPCERVKITFSHALRGWLF